MNNEKPSGKKYSFVRSYTLIPQSPLIHFQHAQEGATLRATEVKPKLDKFLLKRLSATDPKWFVRNEQKALDYKLHFTAIDAKGDPISKVPTIELGRNTPYDIYYGNMGDGEHVKGVMTRVKMTVTCVHPELMKIIGENLAAFFIVTNFGRMQDKGFGSFIIEGFDEFFDEVTISGFLNEDNSAERCYFFDGGTNEQVFKKIKTIYTLMKSGIDYKKEPSLLFSYLQGDPYRMTNERTWLKKEVVTAPQRQKRKYRYVRALLGVGDHIDLSKPTQVSVKISNEEIERLPSPILFKVFPYSKTSNKYKVFYVPGRIDANIYGKTFNFASSRGNGTCDVPTKDELVTESGEDFIDDFLYYCYEEFRDTDILDTFPETRNLKISIG